MARNNNRPLIIGAGILGLIGLLLTFKLLTSGGTGPAAPGPAPIEQPKSIQYVAKTDIAPRTRLRRNMFDEQETPQNAIAAGAFTKPEQIENKLAGAEIYRGQVVTGTNTTDAIARVVKANIEIPLNRRAVAVWVNRDQTAAGLVDVGDHVDVIATHRFALVKDEGTRISGAAQITAGRVIGQDLTVLAVDRSIDAPPPAPPQAANTTVIGAGAAPAAAPAPTPAPPPGQEARTRVVLAAPPEVAARLVAAQEEGKLHIMIRNPASREAIFQVPEVHEYPSRVVMAPPKSKPAAAAASTSRNTNTMRSSDESSSRRSYSRDLSGLDEPMRMPTPDRVTPAQMSNLGNTNTGSGGPTGPVITYTQPDPTKEITVIRGTEKTRVLVPR